MIGWVLTVPVVCFVFDFAGVVLLGLAGFAGRRLMFFELGILPNRGKAHP